MNGTLSIPQTVSRERRRWATRLPVRIIQISLDLGALVWAFVFAYLLRFDFQIPAKEFSRLLHQLPYVVLIQMGILALLGVYSFIWRYVGMPELKTFLRAASASAIPLLALRIFLPEPLEWTPSSVLGLSSGCVSCDAGSTSIRRGGAHRPRRPARMCRRCWWEPARRAFWLLAKC